MLLKLAFALGLVMVSALLTVLVMCWPDIIMDIEDWREERRARAKQ